MSVSKFVRSRYFWIHLGLTVIAGIVILWLLLRMLDLYTHHGQAMNVPDFRGMQMNELESFAEENTLQYEIIDSVFEFSMPKGSVVMQDPAPGSKVKANRKVYLTVVAQKPEQVSMPNLIDLTLRQATAMLETYGLKVGKLQYIPDIARNAVLMQKYKGKNIEEGTSIEKGSRIDLVLGRGEDYEEITVPDIIGLKQYSAAKALKAGSLNVGKEHFEGGNDTASSFVYKCSPSSGSSVEMGTAVDIWYRTDRKQKIN